MTFPEQILGNSLQSWLIGLAAAIGTYVVLKIGIRLIARKVSRLAETTRTYIDDLIVDVLRATKSFFLVAMGLSVGSRFLDLAASTNDLINTLTVLAIILQGGVWGTRAIAFFLNRTLKGRMEEDPAGATMVTPTIFLIRLVVWSLVLLLVLDNLGVDVTALVTGLGIGGIAIALALQTILGDLFASLSIVLDKPFVLGDFVVINEFAGTVEHVGLKTTRVRSLSGEQIVFSNSDLLNSRIRNFKRMFERRILFTVGVTYQTSHEMLNRIPSMIKEIIERQQQARFDRSHFKDFGDFSLNFETVYYVLVPDYGAYMDVQHAINLAIYRKFGEEGIEFAYPTRTVFIQPDGDSPENKGIKERTKGRVVA
jgi:small-conductance mechanosensitive channel